MNTMELEYSPYELRLKSAFSTAASVFSRRRGFILKLRSEYAEGIGDTSPFPEFGSESYEDVEKLLNSINLKIKIDLDQPYFTINKTLSKYKKYPAFCHGLEQALLNLICFEKKSSLEKILGIETGPFVNVNGLIGFDSPSASAKKAKELVDSGYKSIKIKTGRDSNSGGFEEDYKCISEIRSITGNGIKLRIDVNGNWNLTAAAENLKQLEKFNIEFAEQPVNGLKDFKKLSGLTSVPLAPDESVRNINDAKKFIESGAVKFIVIKPMMLGGLIKSLEIIKLADQKNIQTVVSSSFESAIGRINALIAAATLKSEIAHGLSVGEYFENDFLPGKLNVVDGKISTQEL